jgi:hypothetical protein
MARGAYKETAATRGLRQLVDFAESGVGDALTLAEMGRAGVGLAVSNAFKALTPKQVETLRRELRTYLHWAAGDAPAGRNYLRDLTFPVKVVPLIGKMRMSDARPGRLLFFVSGGTPRNVLLFQVTTFLEHVGEDRLSICPAPDCGKVFVKIGRREKCSNRCQRRVYAASYTPFSTARTIKIKKESARGKKTR